MRRHTLLYLGWLAGCQHAGVGQGQLTTPPPTAGGAGTPDGKVSFAWQSRFDSGMGEIQATLPNGRAYSGTYAEIRAVLNTDITGPYFVAWSAPEWAGDPWYGGPPEQFAGANTGKVVALLKGSDGAEMRCKFELRKLDSGMAGGATGECQLSDKEEVFGAELREPRHHGS